MSPGASPAELVDRVADRLDLVPVRSSASASLEVEQRPVADLDRVGPAADLDDRGRLPGAGAKCAANRSGSIVAEVMIDLEVGPARQQLLR